jgi:hypothetical protein
VSKNG